MYPIFLITKAFMNDRSSAFNQLVKYTICGNTNELLPWLSVNYKIKIFKFYNSLPFFNRFNKVKSALDFFLLDKESQITDNLINKDNLIKKFLNKISTNVCMSIYDPLDTTFPKGQHQEIGTKNELELFQALYFYEIGLAYLANNDLTFASNFNDHLISSFSSLLQTIEKNKKIESKDMQAL
jgi:hypothetical protein